MSSPSFVLNLSPAVTARQAVDFFGDRLGCPDEYRDPDARVGPHLTVSAWIDPPTEDPELAEALAAPAILTIVFRPDKGLDAQDYMALVARIVRHCIAFLDRHSGVYALLDQEREEILLRRMNGDIELSSYLMSPEGLNRFGAFDDLARRYRPAELGDLGDYNSLTPRSKRLTASTDDG